MFDVSVVSIVIVHAQFCLGEYRNRVFVGLLAFSYGVRSSFVVLSPVVVVSKA